MTAIAFNLRRSCDVRCTQTRLSWPTRTQNDPLAIDRDVYKWRHLVENFFGTLKEVKRIAMRADKTDTSFQAMIYLGAAIINSR